MEIFEVISLPVEVYIVRTIGAILSSCMSYLFTSDNSPLIIVDMTVVPPITPDPVLLNYFPRIEMPTHPSEVADLFVNYFDEYKKFETKDFFVF